MKKNKKHALLNLMFLIVMLSFVVYVEANKASSSNHDKKTANFGNLDYENIDHLVIIREKATPQDIQFSDDSMRLAKEIMLKESNLFPRVQLEEAIKAYPTPEIVVSFANGFLRVAQFYSSKKNADLMTPLGNHNIKWYFEGAKFYYELTMEFSEKIEQPLNTETRDRISSTVDCIQQILKRGFSEKSDSCMTVNL